jgi:hypothetical protein
MRDYIKGVLFRRITITLRPFPDFPGIAPAGPIPAAARERRCAASKAVSVARVGVRGRGRWEGRGTHAVLEEGSEDERPRVGGPRCVRSGGDRDGDTDGGRRVGAAR